MMLVHHEVLNRRYRKKKNGGRETGSDGLRRALRWLTPSDGEDICQGEEGLHQQGGDQPWRGLFSELGFWRRKKGAVEVKRDSSIY